MEGVAPWASNSRFFLIYSRLQYLLCLFMVNGFVLHARDWWPASWWSRREHRADYGQRPWTRCRWIAMEGALQLQRTVVAWHWFTEMESACELEKNKALVYNDSLCSCLISNAGVLPVDLCLHRAPVAFILQSPGDELQLKQYKSFFFDPVPQENYGSCCIALSFSALSHQILFFYTALDLPWLEVCQWSMHTHLVKQIGTIHVPFIDSHRFNKFQDRTPFRLIWTAENLVHKSTDQLHVHPVQSMCVKCASDVRRDEVLPSRRLALKTMLH